MTPPISAAIRPTVKIGCSIVLSNDADEAVHGRHLVQAMQLAVDQANARGLPFQVDLLVGDDGQSLAGAQAVAHRFVADPQVLGVVGTMNSHTSLATAPIYHAAGLAQISPSASTPALTRQGYDTFFRLVPDDLVQGQDAAHFATTILHANRIAVVHDQTSFGLPLAEVFARIAQEQQAEIVLFAGIERGNTVFSNVVEALVATAPDLVFFAVIEAEGRHLARHSRQAGSRAVFMGTDGLKPSHFLATPGYDIPGPYHTNASTDVLVASSAQPFATAYQERYGELYSIYTAEAYDAVSILIDAFLRAPSLNRSAIRAAVAATQDFPGATGPIAFDAHGDIANPLIGIYRWAGGRMRFLGYARYLLAQAEGLNA